MEHHRVTNPQIPIKDSIGFNLLRGVFSIYIVIAILVTLVHMLTEYFNVKSMIQDDLALYQTTYEKQLADALWDLEEDRIITISEGIIKLPAVTALEIIDANNTPIITLSKRYEENLIEHKFAIKYRRENESSLVGYGVFYSDRATVFNKLSTGFTLIIINSVIKTLALWGIFLWLVKPMLISPLEDLTERVKNITMEELDNITPLNPSTEKNELFVLSQSFNDMKMRLQQSLISVQLTGQSLTRSNNYLEQLLKSAQQMMQAESKKILFESFIKYLFRGIKDINNCQITVIYSNYLSADEKVYFSLNYQVSRSSQANINKIKVTLSNEQVLTELPEHYDDISQQTPLKSAIANQEVVTPFIWKNKLLAVMTIKLSNTTILSDGDYAYLTTLNQLLTLIIKQIDIKQQLENKVKSRTADLEASYENIAVKAQELERISNYKSKFLANMSHEIRTPMNGVLGALQLLQQTAVDNESQELISTALISSNSLLTIINDILDVSKIEAGKLTLELANFDCQQLVKNMINELTSSALAQKTTINLQVSDGFQSNWEGDAVRVRQILLNIVSNAIKFTKNGQVEIQLTSNDNGLSVKVSDTGIGMSSQALQDIFQRFEQADSSTTREYGGTGLGTNIALNLAKLMKGTISAQSELGKGSEFTITLPLTPAKNQLKQEKSPLDKISMPQLASVKVLLAEDNSINQIIFNKLMSPTSAQLSITNNGKECIEFFEKNQVDIIFMDIQMPVMDGITACKLLKQQTNIPIIAITANVMTENIVSYNQAGFDAVLSKPIELDKLYRLCRRYCEKNKTLLPESNKV